MFSIRSMFARRLASAVKQIQTKEKMKLDVQTLEDRITPAPLQFFYVPLPETEVNDAFVRIVNGPNVSKTQESIISISVTENNTVIWYDQHEDGYESILGSPTQKSTLVWGDGNNANGVAPGFVNDPTGLASGTVLRVRNTVNTPRDTTTQPFLFDSPDRFGSNRTVAVSRAQFPTTVAGGGGSVIASAVEVRDTRYFDTSYSSPVGKNTPDSGSMFSYSSLFAQAYIDNTRVQIDANNDGDFTDVDDRDVILNQGQSIQSGQNVLQGARVIASQPVQVNLVTGQISGVYASRSYTLFSDAQSANDYFTPVGFDSASPNSDTTDDDVRLYAYNPNAAAIQVRQESKIGIVTTKTVQPGASAFFNVTTNTGTRLFSVGKELFQAAGVRDAESTTHDWSFSLQPVSQLSEIALVGLGVGNSNTNPSTSLDYAAVFVTVLGATNLQVDYNGDGIVDQSIPMTRLQSIRLTDIIANDKDSSGMRLFTDNGVLISTAWGENGNAPSGSPGFDSGTTVPAVPVPEYFKFSEFAPGGDVNGDGIFNEGDTIRYSLRVRHIGTQPISNAVITDMLPTQLNYINGSARLSRGGATTPIGDSITGTPFPFDGTGYTIATILANDLIAVQFDAQINSGLPAGSAFVLNTSVLSFDLFKIPANDVIKLRGAIGDRVFIDANGNGIDDGEAGLNGVTVELIYDADGDGKFTTGEKVVSTTTNGTGFYQFTDLDGGKYVVRVAASNPNLNGYVLTAGTTPLPIALRDGQVYTTADYGYQSQADLRITKTDGNTTVTPGQLVTYTITVTNVGPSGVTGAAIADTLVAALSNVTWTSSVTGGATVTTGATGSGNSLSALANIPNGGTITFTVTGTLSQAITGTLSNTATVSTPTGVTDLTPGNNSATDTSTVQFTTSPNTPAKLIVSTSELSTPETGTGTAVDPRVAAIGEIVRYRIYVKIEEGITPNSSFIDTLPAGLVYLGNARVGLLGNNGGFNSSIFGTGANISGNMATLAGLASSGITFDASGAVTVSGQTITFNLGDLTNNDRDADEEYAVIEFNALVRNNLGNQSGTTLDNTFRLSVAGTQTPNVSNAVSVYVVEPVITNLAKVVDSVETATADAGDVVTFTATYSNTGNAAAFDVVYTDALPSGSLTLSSSNVVVLRNGVAVTSGFTVSTTGNALSVTLDSVAVSDTIEIRYDATLTGNVTPNQDITTTGTLNYTSLPGAGTASNPTGQTTPGTSGATNGERNGQDGVPTNGPLTTPLNNYRDTDGATINVPNGSIVKTITSTDVSSTSGSNVTIGETITYRLTVTLPEGRTTGLRITDNLPLGLSYVPGSANFVTTDFGGSFDDLAGTIVQAGSNSGDDVTFTFFGINVNGDNNASNNTFYVEFQAVILNVPGNEGILPGQSSLLNTGTLQIGGGPVINIAPVTATVVEPQLQVVKSVLNADTSIDAGTTVNYRVVISHTAASSGPAFDLVIADLLANIGMSLTAGTVTVSNPGYGTQSFTTTGGNFNVTISELRLGDTITIDYSAVLNGQLANGPTPGSSVPNTATVGYDTFPGANAQQRTEAQLSSSALITVNTYSVAGNIYQDLNNNGLYEPGIGETLITDSITVTLTGTDHQGNAVTRTITTTSGTYNFTDLRPSDGSGYTVTQTNQSSNFLDGRDTAGSTFGGTGTAANAQRTPRDADAISSVLIPLNAAQDGTANVGANYNFAELPPATLGDFVFEDLDGNGIYNGGEPGINLVGVRLTGTDDTGRPVDVTTTTNASGFYQFTNLRPSSGAGYTITYTAPNGYAFTVPNSTVPGANDNIDSDANAQGITDPYSIVAGQIQNSVDAGLYQTVTIGDTIFYDINGDGTQNGTESGIPNVQVRLLYAGPDGDFSTTADNDSFTTSTNGNGNYSFANRIPGVYKVQVDTTSVTNGGTLPNGLTATTATLQATTPATLTSGSSDLNRNFGFIGNGSIGDRIFLDVNGDGTWNAGEGLDGVTVTLTADLDGNGKIEAGETLSAITGSDGLYTFNNLRAPANGLAYIITVNTSTLPQGTAGSQLLNSADPDGGANSTSIVTLTAAAPSNTLQDFGYKGPGSIGDTIFLDVNNDNQANPGEGITGVTVTLSGDIDGDGVAETFTTTTNAQGIYNFANLPVLNRAGDVIDYTVAVGTASLPNGVTNTVDPDDTAPLNSSIVTLEVNPSRSDVDFGYRGVGSVGDRVFLDLDGDGNYTPGEGITGVVITLTADVNGDGVLETFTTTTDADGFYEYNGLPVNDQKGDSINYTAKVTTGLPTGVSQSFDPDGTLDNTNSFTLLNNQKLDTVDFGYKGTGKLGDRVWIDANGDGNQGPVNLEPGLPGAKVTLTFAGQDAKFGTADDITATTITGTNGIYGFSNLPQGAYQVTVDRTTVGTNATATFDRDDANPSLDDTANVNLTDGEQRSDIDFGYVGNGFVGDRVFIDQNGDGIQQTGEPNIPSATVRLTWAGADGLLDTMDDVVFTTTTTGGTAGPNYGFPGLLVNGPTDQYRVEVLTVPSTGLQLTDSLNDGILDPTNPITIQVASDNNSLLNQRRDIDFGYDGGGDQSIAGSVYNDLNGNGVRDANEPGIAGVTVRLVGTDLFGNPVVDPATGKAEFLTMTDADGNYQFDTIVPGVYTLTEVQPTNYVDGTDAAGTLGGTPQNDLIGGINVVPNGTGVGYNFGEVGTSITGTVFNDGNRDGSPNKGEPGIPGVTVTLLDANGNLVDDPNQPGIQPYVVVTGPDGKYSFDNIPTGQYKIVETQPAGYGNGPVGPPTIRDVTLAAAGLNNQNFAETLASISGVAYVDANNNGAFDAGETLLANIPVTLTGTDTNGKNITRTVSTDNNGGYRFDNLFPSTVGYTIAEGVASPYIDGKANAPGNARGNSNGPNNFQGVVVIAGQDATGYNFGELAPAVPFISGSIYNDQSRDGVRQTNEPGIAGVTVTLLDAGPDGKLGTRDDGPTRSTTTDVNGNYLFTDLIPGRTYQVVESQPGTYGDGPVGPARLIDVPNLPVIGSPSLNFPEVFSSVSGTVYFDTNADGRLDANDKGLPNVQVTLTGTDVNGMSVTRTTTTDANGNYNFSELPAGVYSISEPTQPAGYVDGLDTAGSAGGVAGNDTISTVSIGGGAILTGYNFSEIGTSVSGTVFTDFNRDGFRDNGSNGIDSGIAGVQLTLVDANGNVVANTTTNSDGDYTFSNVAPGTYSIVETQPQGYGDSTAPSLPVTVTGTPVTNVNFGDTLSTVSGSVYVDINRNGVRDRSESGLGGIVVTLTGTDANGNAVNLTTTTAANGNYVFNNVVASDPNGYTITEKQQPVGYVDGSEVYGPSGLIIPGSTATDSIVSVAVPAGGDVTDNTFGEIVPLTQGTGAISGTVYVDRNENGQLDAGETPLAGVTVTLTDGVNPPIVVLTDANGNYLIPNLTPGVYTVTETQPNGYGSTTPNVIGTVFVDGGIITSGNNFGEDAGSIAGKIFNDANSNGVQDGTERGLGNVTLILLDGAGNAVTNPLTGTPYTTTTNPDGSYLFTDLPSGSYQVVETQPAGFATTINSVGNAGGSVSGDIFDITLPVATDALGYNYGERALPTGVPVSGNVFNDRNGDGQRDPGEPGLPGVTVQLLDGNGNVVAMTITGPDGSYTFPNIVPGNYSIREVQPNGFGDPTVGPFSPNVRPITVATTPITDQNFGDTLGSLGGSVYLDANGNGVRDAGEPGIAGVTVVLTGTDSVGNPVRQTTTTGADGAYNFVNLPAGNYILTELQPSGFFDGADTAGSLGGIAGNDVVTALSLPAGGSGTGYNFGELAPTKPILNTTFVSGTVYNDANGDGVQNPGEGGLAGVPIQLIDANGNIVQTVTTGPDGSYLFINVPAGNFTVEQPNQPTGFGSTTPNTLPITVPTKLTPVTNVSFGEAAATISGTVFVDLDGNGTPSVGEGLGGVILTLTGTDVNGVSVTRTTTTNVDGSYNFLGLPPSNATGYTITETQPTGFGDGADTPGTLGGSNATNDVLSGIVLPAAGSATGYNFAEVPSETNPGTTSIFGSVFLDGNRDGLLTGGEQGLGGVTIQLVDVNGNVVDTVTTNPDGSYNFVNVVPGSYTVRELQPGAYGSSSANDIPVTVPNVATPRPIVGLNFGETLSSLSGSVFNDLNGNGVRDAGEPGIANTTVTLTGTDVDGNAVTRTVSSDANGNYKFDNLPAGSYTVVETQPNGYADGLDSVGTVGGGTSINDQFTSVPLGGGVQASNYSFGERGVNSVSGTFYLDNDLNGVFTPAGGDTIIANAPVLLVGTDANGTPITLSTFTDANGLYRFDNLPAGTFRVIQNQDSLPTTALPADGVYDGAESIGTLGGSLPANNQIEVTLAFFDAANPQNGTGYDFGELPPADPFGYVYEDINGNGVRDAGEPGIAGVTIRISGIAFAGTPFERPLTDADVVGGLTRVTDANGFYEYNPVPPGLYSLTQVTQPTGFLDGLEENADPNGPNTVIVGNDQFSNVVLAPRPVRGPFNFGEIRPLSLTGNVYVDANGNGVRDPGEVGIPNVVLTLTGTDDRGDPVNVTVQTDPAGNFRFDGLRPGTYSITETQPTGLLDGQEQNLDPNGSTVVVGNDQFSNIVLSPTQTGGPFNFGEVPPSSIAGNVYVDANGNGVRDPGEAGLPNVIVTLTGTDDRGNAVNITLTTDATGNFHFSNLRPGTYSVTETQPSGFNQGATNIGNSGGRIAGTDIVGQIVLVPGTNAVNYSFGEVPIVPPAPPVPPIVPPAIPPVVPPLPPVVQPPVVRPMPTPVSPLAPLTPIDPTAPDVQITKRQFLGSTSQPTQQRVATGRTTPDFAALGSVGSDQDPLFLATAEGTNGEIVRVFDLTGGQERFRFRPFPGNPGGARVASGDVNGDGIPDIITAAGPGGAPHVIVYDGNTGNVLQSFMAFEESFTGGLFVAVGDVNGDGIDDVAISADVGGGPRVRILSGGDPNRQIADFMAIDDPSFRGGTRISLGDVNGDGFADLVVGAGVGGGPRVAVYDGAGLTATSQPKLMPDFFAFEQTLRNGVFVTVGDVDGDGLGDLIMGAGPGGAPRVTAFSSESLIATGSLVPIVNFFAGDSASRSGVRVTAKDLNADGRSEIVTGSAEGEMPMVGFYDADGTLIDEFWAEYGEFTGGVFVG